MEISDRDKRHRKIESANAASSAEAFLALSSPEFKIRSRAIVTTMYARTVLSDLFLHGIGGGKYDHLGDLISRAFWGIDPPKFMVLSATVLLPGHEQMSIAEIDGHLEGLSRKRRDLGFQPERFADLGCIPAEMIAKKQSLLSSIPPRFQKGAWHREITALNHQMESRLQSVRAEIDADRSILDARRREATIWNSREHTFCVYPLEYLKDAYQQMLASQI